MGRMMLMFPLGADGTGPAAGFEDEFECSSSMPSFDVLLFDMNRVLANGELVFNRKPDYSMAPAMYRGPRLKCKQYEALFQAAKSEGIRMTTDPWCYREMHRFSFDNYHVLGETRRDTPETRYVT